MASLAMLVACGSDRQSALDPSGPQAGRVYELMMFSFWTAGAVCVFVTLWLLAAAFRRHGPATEPPPPTKKEPGLRNLIIALTGATTLILIVWLVFSVHVGRAYTNPPQRAVSVTVTGHQYWWEVEYPDSLPSNYVKTANEIHVPVGVPVLVKLQTGDVIHSFWVPNLNGKRDLIPGRKTTTWFRADTAGIYRGQCAEFCGHQHAKMALYIVAEPAAQYQAWLAKQRDPAPDPTDSITRYGQKLFATGPCALCHNITGMSASGSVGPDLTHLMSRGTIAAGTLPNNRGNLAGWILDPQSIKPGTKMPGNQYGSGELKALLAYLETLK